MKERASGMVAVEDVLHGVVQDPDKVVSIILSVCKGASVTSAESSIDTVSRQVIVADTQRHHRLTSLRAFLIPVPVLLVLVLLLRLCGH
jgi:hypothetical protein